MRVSVLLSLVLMSSVTRASVPGCQHQESELVCSGLKGHPRLDHPQLDNVTYLQIKNSHIPHLTNISAPPTNNTITTLKIESNLEEFDSHYYSNYEILERLLLENNYITVMNKWVRNIHLKYLDLRGNLIEYIDARTLEIPTLQVLMLPRNKLKEIQAHFLILPSLFLLDVSDNEVTIIDIHAFTNLTSLEFLYLSDNEINDIEHVFSPLTELKLLDLSLNKISYIEHGFSNLTQLLAINLENNKLTNLNNSTFRNLHNLQHIYLSANNLNKIYSTYFTNNPLYRLNMSGCNISYIEAQALPSTLKYLYLDNNQLTNITSATIGHLTNLISLHLSKNHIVHVDDNVLENLTILGSLHLEGNKLEIEETQYSFTNQTNKLISKNENLYEKRNNCSTLYFLYFTSAEYITLAYNLISYLHPYTFHNNSPILRLSLANNQLTRLVNYTFTGLTELLCLNLEYNSIYYIESGVFSGMSDILELKLSGNKICRNNLLGMVSCSLCGLFGDGKFMDEVKLDEADTVMSCETNMSLYRRKPRLTFSGNRSNYMIPDMTFSISPLHILTLAENNITKLSSNNIKKLIELLYLNVSLNAITELNVSYFYSLKELKVLDIESNNITKLDIKFLRLHLKNLNLERIFINGNPWDCDYLVDLIHVMNENNITYINRRKPRTPPYVDQVNGIQCLKKKKQAPASHFNWWLLLISLIPNIFLLFFAFVIFMLQNKCNKCNAKATIPNVEEIELEQIRERSENEDRC